MASSSSSSSSSCIPVKVYDVFISFRGEDTREKFTSHLHGKLKQKKIDTYVDYRLPKGGDLSEELHEAINGSRISVIIFSKNYATSSWCLDEVLWILERKKHGQIVIPVFYEVEPTNVRKQLDSYEEAFEKHKKGKAASKVEDWRAALTEVASIVGWDSQTYKGTEDEFVEAVAKDILEKLQGLYLSSSAEFKDLVGINKSVEEMKERLCIDDSTTIRFIGIWGMGGLGKTTLARVLFKEFSSKFQGCCFLENVREKWNRRDGLERLEKELFSKLLGENNLDSSFAKGKLRHLRVLIVLDDVDNPEQLEFLAAEHDWFGLGSRILVTTRDASVLRERVDDHVYELKGLGFEDALQLFKLNAFKRNSTPTADDDVKLLERMVNYAKGNPLALKVLGSSLRSKRKEKWEIELNKLEEVPNPTIQRILKISYEALDETESEIFLDIACLFSHELPTCRVHVERRLGAHRKFVNRDIDSLIDKSLIMHFKDNNTLVIHDLLKEMGWEIERQSVKESGKHSRFWQEEQLYRVFENNMGSPSFVEGISCSINDLERHWSPTMFNGMHRLWFLNINHSNLDFPQGLQFLPNSLKCLIWPFWRWTSLPSNFAAQNLVELRMPYNDLVQLWSGVENLGNLKYVDLKYSSNLTDISALSRAPNLVSVNLTHCRSLRQVPPLRFQSCDKLTSSDQNSHRCYNDGCRTLGCLQLGFCSTLEVVEKISGNLKELNLCSTSVKELPSSICSLDNLENLHLYGCSKLMSLPSDIQMMKSLRRLSVRECRSLDKLPEFPKNLVELDLGATPIEQVPSVEHLSSLEKLSLSHCRRLKSLPIGISKLKSLKRLDCGNCNQLEIFPATLEHLETLSLQEARTQAVLSWSGFNLPKIPDEICRLSSLETLRLDESNIDGIPVSIKNLSKLTQLSIKLCKRLKSLPELPSSLQDLDASGCVSLATISNSRDALIQGLRSGNHVMTYRRFLYADCLKLNQDSRNNIVSEFQLRALDTGIKSVLPYNVLKISDCPGVAISCPGNEIPMWFTYRSKSSSMNVELSSDWQNTKFLGFALCAVVAENHDWFFQLTCEGNFKTKYGKGWKLRFDFSHVIYHNVLNSNNLFMWYMHENFDEYHDAVEVSFRFINLLDAENEVEVDVEVEESKVTACGIRLLYLQDAEELPLSPRITCKL